MSPTYDYVIVGAGAAGISLACRLVRSPLRDHTILLLERAPKDRDDRTWCFWTAHPTFFDALVYRSWRQLRVVGEPHTTTLDLGSYRYQMIRSLDLYEFARRDLAARPNVTFRQATVTEIADDPGGARVRAGDTWYQGRWVFDSRFRRPPPDPLAACRHYLHMRFLGWEIETPAPCFNPQVPTFLDFRTPAQEQLRFLYVLPLSARVALVEFVACAAVLPAHAECATAPHTYIVRVLGIPAYQLRRQEQGVSPMTDQPFPRRASAHVLRIGAAGGRLKPSTGFGFLRIQQDAAAIVRSLRRAGHPFALPPDPWRYRFYDAVLLRLMQAHGDRIPPIFLALFGRNPVRRVFRFLDEIGSWGENAALLPSLPPAMWQQTLSYCLDRARRRLWRGPGRRSAVSGTRL